MNQTADDARAYLLGALDDRERDLVEEGYFASTDALETVEAAEEALIEDYLANRLPGDEREQFERHYLAASQHRGRLETIRRLSEGGHRAAIPASAPRRTFSRNLLAVAATLTIITAAGVWIALRPHGTATPSTGRAAAPVTFAFSLAPVTVRGAVETSALVIPPGTDVVELRLAGDGTAPPVVHGRVVINTMTGDEAWQGAVAGSQVPRPTGTIAVAEVPANRLRMDDYVVTLLESDSSGAETERAQYFLRVRVR